MEDRESRYWLIVASKDHVENGVAGGIAQACHGKAAPLRRMRKGDFVVFYSSKQQFGLPEKCQQFTAIGRVKDDEVYRHEITPDFCPSRRNIEFFGCDETSILPLIQQLQFIKNKKNWGYQFRFGFLEIGKHDFDVIATQMIHKEYA